LVAWLAVSIVVGYVGSHPRLVAPPLSRLVSRNLLRLDTGGLSVRDFRVRIFEGVDLYGVSVTVPTENGGLTLASADTVIVDFVLSELFSPVPHIRWAKIHRPEVYSIAGTDTTVNPSITGANLNLPSLTIDQLEIVGGYLEFSDSQGRLAERIARLDWRGSLTLGAQVKTVLRGVDVDWQSRQTQLENLRGEVVLDGTSVSVKSVTGQLNQHFVRVGGTRGWDGTMSIQVEAVGVMVSEVENLIDDNIGLQASGDLVGSFRAAGDTLWYEGVFSGEVEGLDASDLSCEATVLPTEVRLRRLAGVINGASVRGVGDFDITDPDNVKFVIEGEAENVDLAAGLVPGEDEMPTTDGSGHFRIEHTDVPLWTKVSGQLRDGRLASIPFDTCLVDLEAFADTVVFHRVELTTPQMTLALTGFIDSVGVFDGGVSAEFSDLSHLPQEWQLPPMRGTARGQGLLSGPPDSLTFTGDLVLADFGVDLLQTAHSDLSVVVRDVLGTPQIEADVRGEALVISDVPLGDFTLGGWASASEAVLTSFEAARGDTLVRLSLAAVFSDSVTQVTVAELVVDIEATSWVLAQPVPVSFGPGRWSFRGLQLASAQGEVSGAGSYRRGQHVDGEMHLSRFDLGLLNPFWDTAEPLQGELTADFFAGGDPLQPRIDIVGAVVDASLSLVKLDSLSLVASFSGGVVDVTKLAVNSEFGRLQLAGSLAHPGASAADFWSGADLDLSLSFIDMDWAVMDQFALPALDRLAGRFAGEVRIVGPTDDPVIHGNLQSAPFNIHWLHLDEMSTEVWLDRGSLVLGKLRGHKDGLDLTGRIELPLEFDLLSEPVSPPDGPFYMQLEIPAGSDLAALKTATNAFVSSAGSGEASVVISGPLDHPYFQGSIKIDQAGFVLRDLEEVYRDVSCEGHFSGDVLTVETLSGKEGLRGSFGGKGQVRFRGLMIEGFSLQLQLDRFLVASIPDLRAVVSSDNAQMVGVMVGPDSVLVPKFIGDLEVHKARYVGDFSENTGSANDPLLGTVAPDWLADLSLHAEPRVARIDNREMVLAMGGNMTLVRGEDGLHMRGSLDVNQGSLVVFNNKLRVQRGRLDFSQEVGFDPRIDLDAQTEYRLRFPGSSNSVIEHIDAHVSGLMSRPVVQFSSERGYSEEAIQRMLLGLSPQGGPNGDSGALANSSISAGFNLLEREIAQEVDIVDTIEIDQIQRQRAGGDTGLDPLIGVGKYIGSDLYLKYAQGLRGVDDLDIVVEYQINSYMLLQSEVRRRLDENQGESTYNLDLKYRFEY